MRKKTSPIWEPSKKEFQDIINKSNSFVDVLKHFGLDPYSGNHRTIKARIERDDIDLTKLNENRSKNISTKSSFHNSTPDSEVFVKNSKYSNNSGLKRKIISKGLIPYCCDKCKCNGTWKNEPITLQIDHINGDNKDNRIENLRFLCPNCHSQTPTFSGKRLKKELPICDSCNTNKVVGKQAKMCKLCWNEKHAIDHKKFDPSKQELINIFKQYKGNLSSVGKFYNVSYNAIKKRLLKLDIDYKKIREDIKSSLRKKETGNAPA